MLIKLSFEEWLACDDSTVLLYHMPGWPSDRQKRLFRLACCRRVEHLFTAPEFHEAVALAERVAAGAATLEELQAYHTGLVRRHERVPPYTWRALPETLAFLVTQPHPANGTEMEAMAAAAVRDRALQEHPEGDPGRWVLGELAVRAEGREHSRIWRELLGNPFAPAVLDPAWVAWGGGTVARLAAGIDATGAFDRLPLLADALEDAGCADAAVLGHCRRGGPHVRGCWVVDLLRGKG